MIMRYRTMQIGLSLLLLWAGMGGCGDNASDGPAATEYAYEKTYARGPLILNVRVDRKGLDIADTLQFELEAVAPETTSVEFPELHEALTEDTFGILKQRDESPRLLDDKQVATARTFTLEPLLTGAKTLPALTIRFQTPAEPADEPGREENAEHPWHEFQTEPIDIEVTTTFAGQEKPDIAKLKDPVEINPARRLNGLLIGSIAAGVLLAGVLAVLLLRRRQKEQQIARMYKPAHELAQQRLWALADANLVTTGQIKEYHERLSYILRWYIEHRFDLKAPERTTQEFLVEAGRSNSLDAEQTGLLQEFLTQCDRVKFAGYQPDVAEADKLMQRAKDFIAATSAVEKVVDVTDLDENALLARSA